MLNISIIPILQANAEFDFDSSYSSSGFSGNWKNYCSEQTSPLNYCVKTTDIYGQEKDVFSVGEAILLDLTNTNSTSWSAKTYPPDGNGGFDINQPTQYHSLDNWKYSIGWSFYGSYLDSSCHAELRLDQIGNNTHWWWVNGTCYSANEKLLSFPNNIEHNTITYHVYEQPGTYVITAIPLVFGLFVPNDHLYEVTPVYKVVTIENTLDYSWMIPIISLILN